MKRFTLRLKDGFVYWANASGGAFCRMPESEFRNVVLGYPVKAFVYAERAA